MAHCPAVGNPSRHPRSLGLALAALLATLTWAEGAPVTLHSTNVIPAYTLKADQVWRLECEKPKRFDASALQRLKDGTLVTLDDKTTKLFRVELTGNTGRLVATEHEFLPKRPARKAGKSQSRGQIPRAWRWTKRAGSSSARNRSGRSFVMIR